MACGKPIIAAVIGDGAEVIRKANAGMICKPDDSVELANTIRAFLKMTQVERSLLGLNGRIAAISNFEMTRLVNKIDHMLIRTIQQNGLKKI